MSDFWSGWIMGLVVLNTGITLFLFIWAQQADSDPARRHQRAHLGQRAARRRASAARWWALFSAACFVGASPTSCSIRASAPYWA